jgi:hypothetical protein
VSRKITTNARLVRLATAYDDARGDEGTEDEITFELPEDLSTLSSEDLGTLLEQATDTFDVLFEADDAPDEDAVATMQALADAADAIRAEQGRRREVSEQNRETAESLAARIRGSEGDESSDEGGEAEGSEASAEGEQPPAEAEQREAVAASSGGARSITVAGVRARQPGSRRSSRRSAPQNGVPTLVASADLGGLTAGDEVTVEQVADALLRRTQGMTDSSYRAAFNHNGRRQRSSIGLLSVVKGFDPSSSSRAPTTVRKSSTGPSTSPGSRGSLLASGGWCSPSETVYDLFELEGTDGLVSVPEFQVARGGIRFTQGPDFATLFADTGFTFTEEDDAEGNYDGGEPGDKPCYKVECPDFTEERLQVTGLCITAGILQNRAYPEVTARTIRGALVGHQHRLAAQTITAIAPGRPRSRCRPGRSAPPPRS